MQRFNYKRSLIAVAVAATASYAQAADQCNQRISQLEQEIQQEQPDQQLRSELQDLIRAAEQNPGDCATYVSRAETLLQQRAGQSSQQTAQSGQSQSQNVTDIQVDEAPTDVNVDATPPEITVRQQPAKIKVIVEQQPPQVEVASSKPEVNVNDPEPEVSVNEAQPNVQVSQSKPKVNVEYAKPEVEVEQRDGSSQAEVQMVQSGQSSSSQQQASTSSSSAQQQSGDRIEQVQGSQALASSGEEIGEVEDFVRSKSDDNEYVLIRSGGTLGMGGTTVAVPVDQVSINQDGKLQTQLTRQEIESMSGYDEQNYDDIPSTEFAALEAELVE